MEEIRTEPQSGGIAIGKAVLLKQPDLAAERREITAAETEKEQAAFRRAAEQVREALRPLARTNAIFAAHLDMAEDATLLQGVEKNCRREKCGMGVGGGNGGAFRDAGKSGGCLSARACGRCA